MGRELVSSTMISVSVKTEIDCVNPRSELGKEGGVQALENCFVIGHPCVPSHTHWVMGLQTDQRQARQVPSVGRHPGTTRVDGVRRSFLSLSHTACVVSFCWANIHLLVSSPKAFFHLYEPSGYVASVLRTIVRIGFFSFPSFHIAGHQDLSP